MNYYNRSYNSDCSDWIGRIGVTSLVHLHFTN